MRSENGIPRPFSPSNLAQELKDLKREVALLKAQRNFVSVERIVEGGTISENVGRQITDTVQEKIVVERHNLAEAALTDVVVSGTIATVGQASDGTPLSTQLTTVARSISDRQIPSPSLVFTRGDEVAGATSPGMYSPDGRQVNIAATDGSAQGAITINPESIRLRSGSVSIGSLLPHLTIDSAADYMSIGLTPVSGFGSTTDLRLVGNVKVNGKPHMSTTVAGMPAGAQPKQIVGQGSATTNNLGVFTLTLGDGGFPTATSFILATPTSGTAGIPVVNAGRLYKGSAEMVIPSAPNTAITYSYLAIGY